MKRLRLQVNGIVQGVGFRPFLHRLARRFALAGWVRNTAAGVEGELEGQAAALRASQARWMPPVPLTATMPPAASARCARATGSPGQRRPAASR